MVEQKDHPFQAIDTELPDGETVDYEAWEALRDAAVEEEGEDDA